MPQELHLHCEEGLKGKQLRFKYCQKFSSVAIIKYIRQFERRGRCYRQPKHNTVIRICVGGHVKPKSKNKCFQSFR